MPLKSKAQQRLMFALKNDKALSKKLGISQNVANEMIDATPKKLFGKLKERMKKKSK